ncbi:hypothetical protein ABCR94_34525 [Streptomyces sp. 21So2-11]
MQAGRLPHLDRAQEATSHAQGPRNPSLAVRRYALTGDRRALEGTRL